MNQSANHRSIQRGFTLTEILVAVAIFAIIFVAALMIYDRSNRVFRDSMEQSDMQQNTRVAFENMIAEIRMAGFDFDRDGTPSGSTVYQQPDEQLEYLGAHAVTFRSNTDYETDAANDNGLEPAYRPAGGQFPIVTTANDEIITYALASEDATKNTDTLTFYADVAVPRATYPGGSNETQVSIPNLDLCDDGNGCVNPPYTLYRITLADDGSIVRSPVASNIRTMDITYFSDGLGLTEVVPNGGDGQYTVSSTAVTTTAAANVLRSTRESVLSMDIRIVGMTELSDPNWDDPLENALPAAEQVAAAKEYRQYELATSIVPRNLGRRGMEEASSTPPGAPSMTSGCAEGCGVVFLTWNAPSYGTVDGYSVIYDTTGPAGSYGSVPVPFQKNTQGYVAGLDPAVAYYFKVVASNSFGSERSIDYIGPITPINHTKPGDPSITGASGDGTTPSIPDDIQLAWNANETNASSNATCVAGTTVGSRQEITVDSGYEIYRKAGTDFTADPTPAQMIWSGWMTDADAPVFNQDYTVTWTDNTQKVPCETYFYRIRQVETCSTDPAQNYGNDATLSYSGYSAISGISGTATTAVAPVTPNAPTFTNAICDPATLVCDFTLVWNEVELDANGDAIFVSDYKVYQYLVQSGIEDTSPSAVYDVTTDPTDADAVVTYSFQTKEPGASNLWHFYVSATTCSGANESALTAPELKFPCSTVQPEILGASPISGDGQSPGSPYLIDANSISLAIQLNGELQSAAISVTDIVGNPIAGASALADPATDIATFANIPLSTTTPYVAYMTLTDDNFCSTTVVRYFQGSVTGCCLVPYWLPSKVGGTFDSGVITMTAAGAGPNADTTVKYVLRNQCDADLTLNRLRLEWDSSGGRLGDLLKITFPDGSGPGITFPNSTGLVNISVPGTTGSTISANSDYVITLVFDRNSVDPNAIIDLCVEYDAGGTAQCSVYDPNNVCVLP